MIALLLRLYPARWRARYGDEFEALLRERPVGPFDVADILLATIDAHLHLRGLGSYSEHRLGVPMSLRLGGFAAMIGGALWLIGFAWAGLDPADSDPGVTVVVLGTASLLVGLAGLSAFQARQHPTLVWAAFALPALGAVMTILGLILEAVLPDQPVVAGASGWYLFMLGVLATMAGTLLFGIATYRTGALPRSGAAILAISAAISLVSLVGALGMGGPAQPILTAGFTAFTLGWVVLGLQAILMDGRSLATGAA